MPWHPLFGVEPTPAGLEPAVLTVILRGMAPGDRIELPPTGSEPVVLPLYEPGMCAADRVFGQRQSLISNWIIHWGKTFHPIVS